MSFRLLVNQDGSYRGVTRVARLADAEAVLRDCYDMIRGFTAAGTPAFDAKKLYEMWLEMCVRRRGLDEKSALTLEQFWAQP